MKNTTYDAAIQNKFYIGLPGSKTGGKILQND